MHLRLRHSLRWLLPLFLPVGILSVFWNAHQKPARAAGPLHDQAYVWQRSHSLAVADSIRASAHSFDAFVTLAAEITWKESRPSITRVAIDYPTLRASGKPIGLAIRIGTYAGSFAPDAPASTELCALARSVLADAQIAGVSAAELQIDFDCAESKLGQYQRWIEALRPVCIFEHARLTITALPSWLDRQSFQSLVALTDGFVLQVHSFQPPSNERDVSTLCDPAAAFDAAERAARAGKPFRVALPTYSYIVGFDARGKVLGISAEGPQPQWPAGTRLRLIRSDEAQLAALVRTWQTNRPANLEAVIWYRLPVKGDALNWRPQTLSSVMAGQTPQPKLVAHGEPSEDGAVQISIVNEGTADANLAGTAVELDVAETAVVAADALGGFLRAERDDSDSIRFAAPDARQLKLLAPGDSIVVGWVRTNEMREVHGHVVTQQRPVE